MKKYLERIVVGVALVGALAGSAGNAYAGHNEDLAKAELKLDRLMSIYKTEQRMLHERLIKEKKIRLGVSRFADNIGNQDGYATPQEKRYALELFDEALETKMIEAGDKYTKVLENPAVKVLIKMMEKEGF